MPALGEWTVRDLTGHTRNVLVGIKNNSATPAESLDIERSVDYFVRAWEGRYDPKAGAERGRQFGKALGSDPTEAIRESARSVLDYLNGLPDRRDSIGRLHPHSNLRINCPFVGHCSSNWR